MTSLGTRRLAARLLPGARRFRVWVEPVARCIEGGARFGYAARGAAYLSIGVMALLAALGVTPRAEGEVGALQAWAAWPPGIVLLATLGVGLVAFAGWRTLQVVFDADRVGTSPRALVRRAGKAASGLVGLGLGASVFGVLATVARSGRLDDQAATQAAVERALAMPGGEFVLLAIGAGLVIGGLVTAGRALTASFTEDLDCDPVQATWAGVLARAGTVAKGAGMVAVGLFTGLAGWQAQPSAARGLGGALETVKDEPLGHALLVLFAAGFIAYGGYAFFKAALRRIGC